MKSVRMFAIGMVTLHFFRYLVSTTLLMTSKQ